MIFSFVNNIAIIFEKNMKTLQQVLTKSIGKIFEAKTESGRH